MNPRKRAGDAAERELAALLTERLGVTVRRKLGAGRTDGAGGDTGDIEGIPDHAIQVASWANAAAAARAKPFDAEQQAANAGHTHGVAMVRIRGVRGPRWVVVMSLDQWIKYLRMVVGL